jgi:pSer/pThr/pTyr-binding forkhead associated (FHA) protein
MDDPKPARIIWDRSDGASVEFPISADIMLIGRDEQADIRLDEPLVSRFHARLERRGADTFLIDLGSTNSTRVNGEIVSERALRHGDELRFSRARCRFVLDDEPREGTGEAAPSG